MLKGRVLKKQADLFTVELEKENIEKQNKTAEFVARKNLKKDGIFVGDLVEIDNDNAICKIQTRKNILIRPPVANIDRMFIVVAPVPKADLYTVDKMLLFCALNKIEPLLCINKRDLDEVYCQNIFEIYSPIVKTMIVSSLDESVKVLEEEIKGICVLAGQSAVGKSSIINALKNAVVTKVDTFSKKIERGKQTTRTVELYKFGENRYLADTAGFSKLDERLLDLEAEEIKGYYPEFLEFAVDCKYKSCMHLSDKDCSVCNALKEGKISKQRYENYKKMCEIVKSIKKF